MDLYEIAQRNAEKFIQEGTTTLDQALPSLKVADVLYILYSKPLIGELGCSIPVSHPIGKTFALTRDYQTRELPMVGMIQNGYSDVKENEKVREMNFRLKSKPITYYTKKLASRWTLEAIQDYTKLFLGNRTDDEISKIIARELTNEIILEMDLEMFNTMKKVAVKENWKFQDTQRGLQHYELIEKITQTGLEMLAGSSYRCRINVFCSNKIAAKLSAHPTFTRPNRDLSKMESIYLIGSIGNIDIYADVYGYGQDECDDYILIVLKSPDEDSEKAGIGSSIMYFPYTSSIYSAPAQDGSTDVIFYNVFRYGVSLNTTEADVEDTNKLMRFVKIEYGEGTATPIVTKRMFVGQIPTSLAWYEEYDKDPDAYDFTKDIKNNLGNLQYFNSDVVKRDGYFTFKLDSDDAFVFFIFEDGEDNVKMNTSPDFNPLTVYAIEKDRKYTITADLGYGEKTYKVLVTDDARQSVPEKIYIRDK